MHTFLTVFMAVCFLPILLIIYFCTRLEGKPRNNLILSTTIPKEAWDDPRVITICKRFYFELNITCILMFLLYIPAIFMNSFAGQFTYIMIWLIAIMVLPGIVQVRGTKKLRALKKENWYHPELMKVQVADTSLSSIYEEKQNSYTFVNFLLPLLISLIPLLYPLVVPVEDSLFTLYLIVLLNAVTILGLYGCYRFTFRKKSDRVNSDITLTAVLTRLRKYYWGKFWLYASWLCALFSFSTLLLLHSELSWMIALLVFTLAISALAIIMEIKISSEQHRLNKEQPSEILVDEDDYWPYGLYYYNKNDSNLMINKRNGLGTTVNLAHPVGMGLTIFSLVLLLACPFCGIWLGYEEKVEPEVVLTVTTVEAWHTGKEYTVPRNEILSCQLLADLPSASKKFGTAMEKVLKGIFSVQGIDSNCKLCLDPHDDAFLLIQTTDNRFYIFSMEQTEELTKLYNNLTQ